MSTFCLTLCLSSFRDIKGGEQEKNVLETSA